MDDVERWKRAAHAMQAGVAQEMTLGSKDTEPKHLRVGINVSLNDHAALVKLLISKGILTEEEYLSAIADKMEEEVKQYESRLSEMMGIKITLG